MKLISWNINGYRAILKKGFADFLKKEQPFILALQETKVNEEQLEIEQKELNGYQSIWSSAERKGYSGVAVFFKEKPLNISKGMGIKKFDSEGRFISLEYKDFFFITAYFPNGGQGPERLKYKMDFYDAFFKHVEKLKTKKAVIFCGDVNTAHNEIDLARPKENEKNTGFLPMERAWLDKITKKGWLDTFRHFNKEPDNYTWWDYKTRARERNVGWRLDYFFINSEYQDKLKNASILKDALGSDHCPIGITIDS
ncbi:MAG: exodeoxyribonuclease III [Elusimicrobiales bacterium]|nr:exodeoxyribonuclease III [Elusimicrobiales bacterium]